jgi:hypothetical protein
LTNFEKRQPDAVFVSAGKKAYLMAIHVQNNPYYLKPFRSLWEKGYRSAKRQVEAGLHPSPLYTRPTESRSNSRTDRPRDRRPRPALDHSPEQNKAKRWHPKAKGSTNTGVPVVKTTQPMLSVGRIEKFNNKYRTQV